MSPASWLFPQTYLKLYTGDRGKTLLLLLPTGKTTFSLIDSLCVTGDILHGVWDLFPLYIFPPFHLYHCDTRFSGPVAEGELLQQRGKALCRGICDSCRSFEKEQGTFR